MHFISSFFAIMIIRFVTILSYLPLFANACIRQMHLIIHFWIHLCSFSNVEVSSFAIEANMCFIQNYSMRKHFWATPHNLSSTAKRWHVIIYYLTLGLFFVIVVIFMLASVIIAIICYHYWCACIFYYVCIKNVFSLAPLIFSFTVRFHDCFPCLSYPCIRSLMIDMCSFIMQCAHKN